MKTLAVATGDVIASTGFRERERLPELLREAFDGVTRRIGTMVRAFEIYRGDSFQGVVEPEQALLAATLVRAKLRSVRLDDGSRSGALDARIAIGIGTTEHSADRVVESDGEAFRASGRALDELTQGQGRLKLAGPNVPASAEITVRLLDAIVSSWSASAADSVFLALQETNWTQAGLARRRGVSQPAISQGLRSARFAELLELLEIYDKALAIQKE